MRLITEELMWLQAKGVDICQPDGSVQNVRVQLLIPISDYPGMSSILGSSIKQQPATYACPRTWHHGTRVANMKTFYDPHIKYV
jgi:hypothetical protein